MPIVHTYLAKKHFTLTLKSFLALAFLLFSVVLRAQLVVTAPPPGPNYTQLLQNFFVGGGVTVSNVTYSGSPLAVGSFTNTGGNLQLTSGIILSSGNRANALGPNNSGSSGTSLGTPGFVELNAIAGSATYDGAKLQFNFVPQSNSITFKYVFASEEYPEFVNGGYNDAFGFFINGPGYGGFTNLALVPGTGLPVTINNVNQVTNSQFYLSNIGNQQVQYDGMTRVLTVTAVVQPCQTYTLKIEIADGGDRYYDSAVFLGDNSLVGGQFNVSATTAFADTSAYENCTPGYINFSLPAAVNTPTTINFVTTGTATSGVDYTPLGNSITIPAGQTSAQLTVNALADNLIEGVENLMVIYQTPCGPDTINIHIRDVPPINVVAGPDLSICNGSGPVTLTAQATGGLPPLTYTWNNGGGNGPNVSVNPAQTTTYTVTVTGYCASNTGTDQQVVNVSTIPTSSFTTTAPACPGSPITVTYTGNASPSATYNWQTGGATTVTGSGQSIQVTYANSGNYNISLDVVQNTCPSTTTLIPILVYSVPASTFTATSPLCQNANGTITYTGIPYPNATYNWNFDGGNVVSGTGVGPYTVNWGTGGTKNVTLSVTWNGCTSAVTTVPVTVYNKPTASFTLGGAICEGATVPVTYTGTADTTLATFNWNWNGGTVATQAGQNYTIQYGTAGQYNITLTVTENGCASSPVAIQAQVNAIPLSTFNAPTQLCLNANGTFSYNGVAGPNATYTWNFDGGTIISGNNAGPIDVSWATSGTKQVTLLVTDNGCSGVPVTMNVAVYDIPTSDFNATTNLCLGTPSDVNFIGLAGQTATYNWNFNGGNNVNGATGAGPYQITWNAAGLYNIDLTVTEHGCVSPTTTQQVSIGGFPLADAGTDVIVCSGQPVQIGTPNVNGFTYEWINTLTDIVDPTLSAQSFTPINILSNIGPDIRTYTIRVSQNGCTSTDDVTVTINPQPIANFVAPAAECLSTNSYDFTAGSSFSTNATFAWTFGPDATPSSSTAQNPTGIVFSTAAAQTVTLDISDYGCTSSFTTTVDVIADPVASFSGTPLTGCAPLEVQFTDLSNYPGATYFWNFGDQSQTATSTQQNPVHTYLDAGSYSVTLQVSASTGCRNSITLANYVVVNPMPAASFTVWPTEVDFLSPIVTITNTSTGGIPTCSYDIGGITTLYDCDPGYTFPDTGTYVITQFIENEFGCRDTAIRRVHVSPASALYIPNAFSPNGDNTNEIFLAEGVAIKNFQLYIFNRWGQQIFSSSDITKGWNGKGSDGEFCPIDVYPYRVFYEDMKGVKHDAIGRVSLIR